MMAHAYNPAIRKLKCEDCEFQASLGYIGRICLKKKKKKSKSSN
jgi:hypothetical protein